MITTKPSKYQPPSRHPRKCAKSSFDMPPRLPADPPKTAFSLLSLQCVQWPRADGLGKRRNSVCERIFVGAAKTSVQIELRLHETFV
eukprot:4537985-Pleurochrysis_carterae.AAC.5